jgi:DNA-binding CsgD family transcriptional regulator
MRRKGDISGLALTPREWDVMRAMAVFDGQQTAAHALGMSYQTLKNHLTSVYRKLSTAEHRVTTQTEAFVAVGWLLIPSKDEFVVRDHALALAMLRVERERLQAATAGLLDELSAELDAMES